MPALGLDVPKRDIDKLFDEWDSDGGGSIDFKELQKILKGPMQQISKMKAMGMVAKLGASASS